MRALALHLWSRATTIAATAVCLLGSTARSSAAAETPTELPERVVIKTALMEATLFRNGCYNLRRLHIVTDPKTFLSDDLLFRSNGDAEQLDSYEQRRLGNAVVHRILSHDQHFKYEKRIHVYDNEPALKLSHKVTYVSGRLTEREVRWKLSWHSMQFSPQMDCYVLGKTTGSVAKPFSDAGRKETSFQYWLCVCDASKNGFLVLFPDRDFGYRFFPHLRQAVVSDKRFWRFSDAFKPGYALEQECWITVCRGEDPNVLADRTIREVLSREKDDSNLKHCLPYAYRGFPDRSFVIQDGGDCLLWSQNPGCLVYPDSRPARLQPTPIELAAAQNDWEPIQLVLKPKRDLRRVSVVATGLRAQHGEIPPQRIDVRHLAYVDVQPAQARDFKYSQSPSATKRPRRTTIQNPRDDLDAWFVAEVVDHKNLGVRIPRYFGEAYAVGELPDLLYEADTVALEHDRNHPVFITVRVPSNARAGLYQGEVLVMEGGRIIARAPLRLRVWDFAIPSMCTARMMLQSVVIVEPVYRRMFYQNLANHKVSIHNLGQYSYPRVTLVDGKVTVDFSAFDQWMHYCIDELGMHSLRAPWLQIGGQHSSLMPLGDTDLTADMPGYADALRQYTRLLRAHLREKGWVDRFVCYLFDEPDAERLAIVRKIAPIIHEEFPEAPTFMASGQLVGNEDIVKALSPRFGYYDCPFHHYNRVNNAEALKAIQAKGKQLWFYNCTNGLGQQPVVERMIPWVMHKHGVTGFFFWTILRPPSPKPIPLGMANYFYMCQDGRLFDTPRWEMIREGVEDYEYAVLLEERLQRLKQDAKKAAQAAKSIHRAEAALAAFDRYVIDSGKLEVCPEGAMAIRNQMAQCIEELTAAGR